jgi:hypothetical protein
MVPLLVDKEAFWLVPLDDEEPPRLQAAKSIINMQARTRKQPGLAKVKYLERDQEAGMPGIAPCRASL